MLLPDLEFTDLRGCSMVVTTSTPEALQQLIARDIEVHAELVKAPGLVPQQPDLGFTIPEIGLKVTGICFGIC